MIRTFKYIALTAAGTPQPVFGPTLGAATVPGSQVSVLVADSSFFQKEDFVNFDVGANEERTTVFSVPDATHIVVAGLTLPHASGTFVRLSGSISALYIQTKDGNTGAIFIGNNSTMVKATGVGVIKKLQQVAAAAVPTEFNSTINGFPGPLSFGEVWFDGTTADNILPSALID